MSVTPKGSTRRTDFDWTYTDEPHATRRAEMLKAHPELKCLYTRDPSFPWVVCAIVITQLIISYNIRDQDWTLLILMIYFVGSVFNHALLSAIHEVTHNLAFGVGHPVANKLFGMFANIPLALGLSVNFKDIHLEHHRYLGEDTLDWTLPCDMEVRLFNTTGRKMLWLFFHPFFEVYRQYMLYARKTSTLGKANMLTCLAVSLYVRLVWGQKAFLYLSISTFVSGSWHPTAGRFIQEHGLYKEGQDTYSYYGPLNAVMFNIGYHVEHHDLPYVPGRYLPLVRKIAPEFYQDLYHHTSWVYVMYRFATDPNMGHFARTKRRKTHQLNAFYDATTMSEYIEMARTSIRQFSKKALH